jgi:hypothetical protein
MFFSWPPCSLLQDTHIACEVLRVRKGGWHGKLLKWTKAFLPLGTSHRSLGVHSIAIDLDSAWVRLLAEAREPAPLYYVVYNDFVSEANSFAPTLLAKSQENV